MKGTARWTRSPASSPRSGDRNGDERLYSRFASQTYPDKLLVVADDSPSPSPFFSAVRDPRVRYHHTSRRASIGEKRNACIRRAADASIVAHFDDDDWYAPTYLAHMRATLDTHDADLAKLAVWHAVFQPDGSRWRWDTRRVGGPHCALSEPARCLTLPHLDADGPITDAALWGYGFSYVYRRAVWTQNPFPDRNRGEDYGFVRAARAQGARGVAIADAAHLVWHTVHAKSTSRMFPQTRLDAPTPAPVRGGQPFTLLRAVDALGLSAQAPRPPAARRPATAGETAAAATGAATLVALLAWALV